jgi:hypothetical protein
MLDAAKATDSGAGNPATGGLPNLVVSVRNDTGGDLAAFDVVRLGDSILDVTTPLRVAPTPTFEGLTPEGPTDAFAVLVEPVKDGKFALAVVAGVVPCEVSVGSAGHDFAAPGTTTERLTSAASGPARILAKSADTGTVDAVVLLSGSGGRGVPGALAGGGPCELAGVRTEDCVNVATAAGDFKLTWDAGSSKFTSADTFAYPLGTGVFAFWFSAGVAHLSLAGNELMNCGNGCFTGGALTGHATQTVGATFCDGEVFTVCVSCVACDVADCTCFDSIDPVSLTLAGFDDVDCGGLLGVAPLALLNASWQLDATGPPGSYALAAVPVTLAGDWDITELTLACAGDEVSGVIVLGTNGVQQFEFHFSGATNEPGNTCSPLSIAVNTWTAPMKCGTTFSTVMPTGSDDVTGEVTE